MDCLPDDILTQILVKVPCDKSIFRCTSVCKSWYSYITSPVFITIHLLRSNNAKYLFCDFVGSCPYSYHARYLSIHHDDESFVERNRLLFPGELSSRLFVHGCCNGLICYSKTKNGLIYLWNPTVRKVKVLPRYRNYDKLCFGFWFDKRVNDHMVAKISTDQGLSVDVYSLSTNSWKTITESIPAKYMAADRDLVYVDGKLHWPVGRIGSSESWMICSLDIEAGILRETLIISNKKLSDLYLTPHGEHYLAVVIGSEESLAARRCCMVQVYDQNMNKLYTIDLESDASYDLHSVVGSRNNGEALFLELDGDDSRIISCNTATKAFEFFVWGVENYKLHRVRPFIETLVLLDDGDAEDSLTPNTSSFFDFRLLCL